MFFITLNEKIPLISTDLDVFFALSNKTKFLKNSLKMETSSCIFNRKAIVIQQENLKVLENESKVIFKEKERINSSVLGFFNMLLMFGALYVLYIISCVPYIIVFYKKEYD